MTCSGPVPAPPDTRLVPAALAGWLGAFLGTAGATTTGSAEDPLAGLPLPLLGVLVLGAAVVAAALGARRSGRPTLRQGALLAAAAVLVGLGALAAGHARVAAMAAGPVVEAAASRSSVAVHLVVAGDPLPRSARPGSPAWMREQVRVTASVRRLAFVGDARAPPTAVDTPVLVFGPGAWADVGPGDVVSTSGRLRLPDRPGPVAALLDADAAPAVVGRVPSLFAWGDPPREALREAVTGFRPDVAGLLPSLVVGDETLLTDRTRDDLRVTGLAHLTAVSGANVAIVLGAVLLAARWAGVRAHALPVLGLLAVAGFVVLARPEPSVVRASAMGVVVVLGLVAGGRGRGVAPLALAVCVLVLADPWLSRSIGFGLSCAATAGIVVLARPWTRAARWMPRPLAAALAVPLAAQLACTPLLVGMSGQLSLSAVPANLLAAPAVPPATVLGIAAAALGVVAPAVAQVVAAVAMVPTGWIVLVAQRCADLPGTVVDVAWAVPVVGAGAALLVAVMPAVLRSPVASVAVAAALVVVLLRPVSGWPPPGWVVVACDVGQGDAMVVRTGPGQAVLVDTGPSPHLLVRCLDELGVRHVPLVVLSHFDTDHAGGLAGLGADRGVEDLLVTIVDEPAEQAARVARWAAEHDVRVSRGVLGRSGARGDLTWRVLWPRQDPPDRAAPNLASLVLRLEVAGVSVLATGDIDASVQRALLGDPALEVDVLKVPHHGSADQDRSFLESTRPALAVISVGRDNPYGQPAESTVDTLAGLGAVVARTDTDGHVAVGVPGADGDVVLVRRGVRTRGRGMLAP